MRVRGATWCPCDRARADLHPRGLACAFIIPLCTRTQLGTHRLRTRGDDTSTQGTPQLQAAAAGESSMRVRPRLAACGPARLAPTTTRHASGDAATAEEVAVDLVLRDASRSAVALVAEGQPSRRDVLTLDVEDGRQRLRVEKVGVEGAAPSRSRSRARCSRRAPSASSRGDAHPSTAMSMRRLIRRCEPIATQTFLVVVRL